MFQRTIATSRWTFPWVCALALVCWIAAWLWTGDRTLSPLGGLCVTCVAVFSLTETNNSYALLRRGSRLMCSLLFLLVCADPSMHTLGLAGIMQTLWIFFFFALFATYARPQKTIHTFVAFLALGCATLCVPCMVWLIPVAWAAQVLLRSLDFRSFVASSFGILTPWLYYLLAGYLLDRIPEYALRAWEGMRIVSPLLVPHDTLRWALAALCLSLFVAGGIDFLRNRSLDKTRTRYNFYAVLLIGAAGFLLLALQPARLSAALPLCMLSASMLGSRFMSASFGKWKNALTIAFAVLILAACAWGVFHG